MISRRERAPPGWQADLAEDRTRALALTPVSRETEERLDRFVALLLEWQDKLNLFAPSTTGKIWTRHIADSLQLLPIAPEAKTWIDFGSGAGFPGLIIACALAQDPNIHVHLVEKSPKKAAFLRAAAQITGAPATVHAVKIVDFVENFRESADVVTARALAPLADLLASAYPLLTRGALGLFPKGQDVEAELTAAAKCWITKASLATSRTDPLGRIVVLKSIQPVSQLMRAGPSKPSGQHTKRKPPR